MSFTRSVNPRILELIQREDCSVEELLDANATNDINSQNEQILKFFTHEKLGDLIDLITVMPSEEDSHDRQHRFPFQANEIFVFKINALLQVFEAPEPLTPKAKAEDSTIIKAGEDHNIDTDDGDEDDKEELMRITIDKDEEDRDYDYQHIEQEEGETETQNSNADHLEEENQDKLEQIDTPINRKNSTGSPSGTNNGRTDLEMQLL